MHLNSLIHFVLLGSANNGNSFANKIAFSIQRKQLKRLHSSFIYGDAICEALLFLYASPYWCRK